MSYVTLEELKNSLSITNVERDADLQRAIDAATRVVDALTLRTFEPGSLNEVRYFTPVSRRYLIIGDVISVTSVVASTVNWVDGESQATGYTLIDGTDYYLDGNDTLRMLGTVGFQIGKGRSVQVTAQWGWSAPPPEIEAATAIIATQLFKRVREAPFGVLATSLDGAAIRIGRTDPQVDALLLRYKRSTMVE